jgi:hypothetical protein
MPMRGFARDLTKESVEAMIARYLDLVKEVGTTLKGASGLQLLQHLKRTAAQAGPYPHVTIFEAANRIMSDLVILYGVKWMLETNAFPFDSYKVEFGNEDNNGFDIRAVKDGKVLVGEACNVAPSFFPVKKASMLKKLSTTAEKVDYKLVLFNRDAISAAYKPKLRSTEVFVCVDVGPGNCMLLGSPKGVAAVVPRTR